MQPKMKPLTVNWSNGPNSPNKKQRHVHTFFFELYEFYEYNQWRSVICTIEYYRYNSKVDLQYCCFMHNSCVLRLMYVLDVK